MKQQNSVLFIGGIIFGFGLAYGKMSQPEIVLSFLERTDFGLIVLMAAAFSFAFVAINIVPRFIEKPILGGQYKRRERTLSKNSIIGAIVFGVGWGISGLCPGAAISSVGVGNLPALAGIASMFLGAYVMGRYFS
jgi:uncharacterized protein